MAWGSFTTFIYATIATNPELGGPIYGHALAISCLDFCNATNVALLLKITQKLQQVAAMAIVISAAWALNEHHYFVSVLVASELLGTIEGAGCHF